MKSKDPYYKIKKRWREEHRKECKKMNLEYYYRNKEKINEERKKPEFQNWLKNYQKIYGIINHSKLYEYNKSWRKNNKEKFNSFFRNYNKKNLYRIKAYNYVKRNNQKRYFCELCEIYIPNLNFHHTNYENNEGFTVCKPCHNQIHKFDKNIGGN